MSQAAWAQNFLANKKFNPTTIGPNATSTLEFDLFNASSSTLSSTVTDTLPATTPAGQLWFDSTEAPTTATGTGCTAGTWTFSDQISGTHYQTATFTAATVPNNAPSPKPGPDCSMTLPVHSGALAADTNLTNTVPGTDATATGDAGTFTSQDFSATLNVKAPVNVGLTKQFNGASSATIPAGGTATLKLVLTNPSIAYPLTGVSLTDDMTSLGLTVVGTPTSSGCGTPSFDTSDANKLVLTDATIAAATGSAAANYGTCTITVTVQAPTGGSAALVNTLPASSVQSDQSSTNSSSASATLNTVSSFTMTKAFVNSSSQLCTNDTPLPAGFTSCTPSVLVDQPVKMRVYFTNPNVGTALTDGTLQDLLPNDIVNVGTAVTGTCGSPTMNADTGTPVQLTFSSITVPAATATALGSCYIEIWVKPTATFTNNTNAISSSDVTFAGDVHPDNSTSANLTATAPGTGTYLNVGKQFWRDNTNGSTSNATNGQTGTGTPMSVQKGEVFWMKVSVSDTLFDQSFTGGSIYDDLPLGVEVATPLTVRILQNPPSSNTTQNGGCGNGDGTGNIGTVSVAASPVDSTRTRVTYSGFDVRNGSGANTGATTGCFYSIELVSTTPGVYQNTISSNTLTTTEGATNPSAANAKVAVLSDLDTSKFFDPSTVSTGGRTRLYINFSNKATTPITGLAVTDTFPASSATAGSLTIASPANATTTCDNGSAVVTATPGGSSVAISGGYVPAATDASTPGTCQIAVDVQHVSGTSGSTSITNTIAADSVSNDQGQSNPLPVTATLTIQPMGIQVVKSFSPSNANGGAPVLLKLVFSGTTNPNSTGPQDNITLTDTFPDGMIVAPTPNATTTCRKAGPADGTASPALSSTPADITANPGAPSFTVSGFRFRGNNYGGGTGSEPDNQCEVDLYVVANTTGNKTNTIPVGAITTSANTTNTSPTSATLTVLPNTQLSKSFSPAVVSVGQPTTLTLTINNVNTSEQDNFDLTDNFPDGMTVAGAATTTCGDGVPSATVGDTSVSITGGDVAANGSCTITLPVLLADPGEYTNDQSNITASSIINTDGVTAKVTAIVPPAVTKEFSPNTIVAGSQTTLTITLNNPNASTALSNVRLTDTLPNGTYVYATPASTNTCGGTFAPAANDTTLSLTGGAIAAGGSCVLTVQVTGTSPGSYTNTIPAGGLKSDQGDNVDPTTDIVTITPQVAELAVTKNVSGGPSGYSGSFPITVSCTLDDAAVTGITPSATQSVTAGTGTNGTVTFGNIPQGSTCQVSEGAFPTAPTGYQFSGTAAITQPAGPIAATGNTATVVNTLVQQVAGLTVVKTVTGGPAGYSGSFTINVTCSLNGDAVTVTPSSQAITASNTQSGTYTFAGIPAGAQCQLSETLPNAPVSYSWGSSPTYLPSSNVTIAAEGTSVTVQNTLTQQVGSLAVTKTVQGGPANYSNAFPITVACSLNGSDVSASITPAATQSATSGGAAVTFGNIPQGASCTVSENAATVPAAPSGYQWGATTITPSTAITITAQAATASVQNTLTATSTAAPVPTLDAKQLLLLSLLLLASGGFLAAARARARNR
ncbi:MAG: DUF5979 domain-containing protein [Rudaea sp.]|uniref:beta strand repeat-containing protein n=1 Tax=Rudaea sp. TaxID=2136325 RepID=UPI0039E46068